MWRRLIAGGPVLVCFRAVAALLTAVYVTTWSLGTLSALVLAFTTKIQDSGIKETGDIRLLGFIAVSGLFFGGAFLVFVVTLPIAFVVLSLLPASLQVVTGVLLIIAPFFYWNDRPGHFALRYQVRNLAQRMTHPASTVPPFSLYISPAKERELRREGHRRMRVEWVGDSLRVKNLTAESARLRIDFYGAYSHNSSINCRGDREVPVARLPIVPAQSTYTADRVICGDGFKAYSIQAWNNAGETIFYESTH